MICKKCAKAADTTGRTKDHPKKCGCDCKHMPRGSWNGGGKS